MLLSYNMYVNSELSACNFNHHYFTVTFCQSWFLYYILLISEYMFNSSVNLALALFFDFASIVLL